MSKLGSLYIQLGEPEGELAGCCETAEWAADYIESLRQQLSESQAELNEFRKNAKVGFDRQLRDQQKLETSQKREVMLRVKLSEIAWSNDSKWQSDCAKEALAATANLDGLILCKKKPTAWCRDVIYEMPPEFAFSWVETQLHEFPLYRAWDPK